MQMGQCSCVLEVAGEQYVMMVGIMKLLKSSVKELDHSISKQRIYLRMLECFHMCFIPLFSEDIQ